MDTIRDESLMGMFCDGKPEAFQLLFERYRDKVFRFIHAVYMKNRANAEDCTQETFIKVIQHRYSFNREMSFAAWLYAIARNHCLNQIRQSKAMDLRTGELRESTLDAPDKDSAQLLENRELGRRIQSAVHGLQEKPRAVFVLREIEGLPYSEISEIMGMEEGSLRTQLHRAKTQLRRTIAPYLEENDGC